MSCAGWFFRFLGCVERGGFVPHGEEVAAGGFRRGGGLHDDELREGRAVLRHQRVFVAVDEEGDRVDVVF